MKISEKTRISKLIKHNPKVIDVIASINSNFKKLKNPVLRKLLAPRVSIENAAKIGGVSVNEFMEKLATIGFVYTQSQDSREMNKSKRMYDNFELENAQIVELDVRPDLEQGNDPFIKIMAAIDELKENEILKLVNTFEPAPIVNVLKQKGFSAKLENPSSGLFFVFFKKISGDKSANNDKQAYTESLSGDFEKVFTSFGNNYIEMDVRGLEMPQPMVQILGKLNELSDDSCLYVHHKKVPQFLLPQLKERGYTFLTKEIGEDNVKMLIFKEA